jgi:nicotinamidase-related amidase
MDAILIVDMQVGLLDGTPKHDLDGVIGRINRLTFRMRASGGKVVFVQHCGDSGDRFEPNSPGWQFLPQLRREPGDAVVRKTLNDPFQGTDLQADLQVIDPERVLITGWATDLCVDATVRSAVSNSYDVVVVADGHTVSDRPHLVARDVIRHHHWVWGNLLTRRSIRIASAGELLCENGA